MTPELDVTIVEPHLRLLEAMAAAGGRQEAAAYLQFGTSSIAADPWSGKSRDRLVSHRFVAIGQDDAVDASPTHVTWSTRGFMRLLKDAMAADLLPGIVHTHPGSTAYFSKQDDANERELARTAANRGAMGLVSLVLGGDGTMAARLWMPDGTVREAKAVQTAAGRFKRWTKATAATPDGHLERQTRLFGPDFNPLVRSLRVAVIGGGGTGSAVAMLLARLGVGHVLLIDKDTVEDTNLNRVHGSRRADVAARMAKVDALRRELEAADLGVEVRTATTWAGDPLMRDALKACDFIFGCTDDHSGRITLNRLAYFYGIPVIDVGLRMMAAGEGGGGHFIQGRTTTLIPGRPCLLCSGVVNAARAAEEDLQRTDPAEFDRRKAEAYVLGGGDPAPAVVTFTTEMACVAVGEMLAALTGCNGEEGMLPNRTRRFHLRDDRSLDAKQNADCPVCSQTRNWGRADVEPFLDVMG